MRAGSTPSTAGPSIPEVYSPDGVWFAFSARPLGSATGADLYLWKVGDATAQPLTQPVAVTRNGRERTVMISVEEYHRLKRRDRQVLGLEDFTDADIAALEQTRAPAAAKAFNDELKPT